MTTTWETQNQTQSWRLFAPPVPTQASFQQLELPLPGFFPFLFFFFLIKKIFFLSFLSPIITHSVFPQVVQ